MTIPDNSRFITLEGVEGAGKTTHLAFVRDLIEARGEQVVLTREPGGTALGEEIRDVLLGHRRGGMTPAAELLLMFAARAEHLDKVILPALAEGKWVVCDRFTDATFAYQGGGRGIPLTHIAALADWVHGGFRPALTLLLDVPVGVGRERAGKRAMQPDRFESEEGAFFERVRATYLDLAAREPGRFRVIDAAGELETVQHSLREVLQDWLSSRPKA